MLWFFTRDRDSMHLETRYDNDALEYVGTLTYPDGHQDTRRFATADAFTAWLATVEQRLAADRWAPDGAPLFLADGWPDKKPKR